MADMYLSREEQKERLKKSVIDNKEPGERHKGFSPVIFAVLIVTIAALCYGAYYYLNYTMKTEYTVEWERTSEGNAGAVETFKDYVPFSGGVIKYTKDGAEYIDKDGRVIWERSYQLNSPIIDVSNDYAVIADQGGTSLFIFNDKEVSGTSETVLPISLIRISDNGVAYAVLDDNEAEYITAFRADGSAIDLSVKSILTGDGYPFDIDVSPDGTELITSYVGIDNGMITNNVVFRNFGSVGQNEDARRIVGGFKDEFEGHLAGRVHFATNESSQAFYDGGVVFFSTKVLNTPEVLANVSFEEEIAAIAYNANLSAVLLDTGDENHPYRLEIYNNKGAKTGEVQIDFKYKEMCVSKDLVVLSDSSHIEAYSRKGGLRIECDYQEGDLSKVIGTEQNNMLITVTGNTVKALKF